MDFKRLAGKAKQVVDKRGGTEALKGDLQELRGNLQGGGTLQEKAKRAADGLKEPGGKATPEAAAPVPAPVPVPAEGATAHTPRPDPAAPATPATGEQL